MNTKRIKEIQRETAYPDSISVQQALLKVWNECEQVFEKRNNQFFRVENKLKTSWLNFLTNQINEGASNCKKNNDQSANL